MSRRFRTEKEVLAAGVPIEVFEGYGYHDWTFWRTLPECVFKKIILNVFAGTRHRYGSEMKEKRLWKKKQKLQSIHPLR